MFNSKTLKTFSTTPKNNTNVESSVYINCPLCGESLTRKLWITDHAVFGRCIKCKLWRQNPQPKIEHIAARYDESYLAYETKMHFEYRAIALKSLAEAGLNPSDAFNKAGQPKTMLEIGCATGALLSAFDEKGWVVKGIEISPEMAKYAKEAFNIDVFTGTLEEANIEKSTFDVVLATHLIEHLNDPVSFIKAVKHAMTPQAELYLITPNADGFQAKLKGSLWRSVIRDHLFLFSLRTLKLLLQNENFYIEYSGTWGGWPAGMKPKFIKKTIDRCAKLFGIGDVMIIKARLVNNDQ